MKNLRKILIIIFTFVFFAASIALLAPEPVQAVQADSSAVIISVGSGTLNVRSSASTSSSIVTRLSKGSYVTLISKTGSWWRVEYAAGKYGYCSASYIHQVSGTAVKTVTNVNVSVNIRSGPGTSYKKLGTLAKGTNAVVLSSSNGWSRVLYAGTKTGYISNRYLGSIAAYPAIRLTVPRLRQGDSRWSSVTLGSASGSSQTIARIGCTTCCISMLESYRTGTTVRPDVMASRLKYTSGGALYWPDNYITNSDSDYLARIYSVLKQGKPVIVGGKTSSGRQHWVVVTGYSGGNSLKASGFIINDPASTGRTNLQQLFNDYPTFHRMAYYK